MSRSWRSGVVGRRSTSIAFSALAMLAAGCACQVAPASGSPCDPPLATANFKKPAGINPDGVSQFGAFTGCAIPDQRGYTILAMPPTPSGWNSKSVSQRLTLRYNAFTTNKLGGVFEWPHPGAVSVSVQGGVATVNLPADFYDDVIVAPGGAYAIGLPLFWAGFLEPSIQKVQLTLDGDAQALADKFEASVEATTMPRSRYESQLASTADRTR